MLVYLNPAPACAARSYVGDLGEGEFGQVILMEVMADTGIKQLVAVKMLKVRVTGSGCVCVYVRLLCVACLLGGMRQAWHTLSPTHSHTNPRRHR